MRCVLTLVGTPDGALDTDLLDSLLRIAGTQARPVWLDAKRVCDIECELEPGELQLTKDRVVDLLGDRSVDFCLQPTDHRKKSMLIADMDSTIIQQECIDEIADFAGIKPQVAAITEQAMRGELDFEAALEERIALVNGIHETELQKVIDQHLVLMPGARTLVQTMRRSDALCVLVSGGFTFFTSAIADKVGFHHNRGNELLFEEGKLSGVGKPILGREAKLDALNEYTSEHNIPTVDVIAVGDGANDLLMLEAAGLGVAYHAKPVVAAQADASVKNNDLTALLYFQGYARSDFTEEQVIRS